MRRTLPPLAIVALIFVLADARPAHADWLFTPFLGVTFGGSTSSQAASYGAGIGYMGARVVGAELQVEFTPNFFETESNNLEDSNVATVMGNVIVGAPLGSPGIRPYVSGGAGILRTRATSADNVFDLNENAFGVNVGAGVIGFVRENFGLRLDVRFFRRLKDSDAGDNIHLDLGDFQYWRAAVGGTFRF